MGHVDKRDSQGARIVFHAGICDWDQLGTRPDLDKKWAFHACILLSVRAPDGRKPANHHLVLGGIFWTARTPFSWRDLPEKFGKWSSVYRQFRRWTLARI